VRCARSWRGRSRCAATPVAPPRRRPARFCQSSPSSSPRHRIRLCQGLVVFKVDDATWTLDLRAGKGKLTKGEPPADEKADITLTMADAVFVGLVSGKTSAQQAFIMRKLKINGSMGLAARLQPILDAAAPKAKM
jgi:putative sterol carrier protein